MQTLFLILFFYGFSFSLAGIMAYTKLNKENVLKEEEKKIWKKWIWILVGITVTMLLLTIVSSNVIFIMPKPLPYHYDFPTHIRLAVNK